MKQAISSKQELYAIRLSKIWYEFYSAIQSDIVAYEFSHFRLQWTVCLVFAAKIKTSSASDTASIDPHLMRMTNLVS